MRDHRTPEQVIRAIMEGQANAATLEYGTDLARDTYADDTPGQEPGDHTGKFQPVLANKTATAVDGVPKKGGEMVKPNPERLAGLGQKESYKGNPYLQMAKSDIIQENAYDQFVEMSDVEFDDMIDVLTIEELNDLEEGIISGTGKLIGSAAKGVGKLALGTVKLAGKGIVAGGKAAANRLSTKGRADAAEKKLKKLQDKKRDKERLAKAKQGLKDLKGKPIPWRGRESVQDSHALGSRDYWTETDEQDLTEGKMSKAEVKKHAAAIFKMRQQKQADAAASKALSKPKSAAAKAARRDAADAGYGTPMSDPADRDVRHKPEKRGRGQKDLPHIVSQLRGVVDTKDGAPSKVKFKDGTTKDVKPKHAQAWLKKHDSAKPHEKLDMYKSHDSHKSFKSYAKEAVEADDKPKLKKLAKGLQGSVKGHAQQVKDIEKIIKDEKEFKVKNCGCGEDPCKTYGSKEEQMKDMQEAPGQRAWDRSSKGRAYRRLSDEEKARLLKKNELMRRAKAMKGDDAAYSTSRMRKPTLGAARQTYRGKKRTRREHNEMMEGIILGIEAKLLLENKDKCGPGEYWCTKDMKCKPIPKGMTTDKDGMLVKEGFKNYKVTHKPSGKQYRITAMHDKSAKDKARRQHGGTASRYSGTSTDDFHVEEKMAGVEYYPRMKAHGKMTDAQKKAVTAVYDKKKVDKKMADDPHVKKAQRYMKVEQAMNAFMEESSWVQRVADTWNDHADHPHPKVQHYVKKAEKAYNDKDYDSFHRHTENASTQAYKLRQKKKPNVQPKGAMGGPKKINHNPNVKESAVASIPKKDWEKARNRKPTRGVIIIDKGKTHSYKWKKGPDGKPLEGQKDDSTKKRIKDFVSHNEAFNYKAMAKDYLSKNKGKKHSVDSVQAHLKATEHEYDTHQSVADKHGHNAGETMYHVKKMTQKKPVNEIIAAVAPHVVRYGVKKLINKTKPKVNPEFKKLNPSAKKPFMGGKPGYDVAHYEMQGDQQIDEISNKMKVDYINKANKEITKSEKQLAKAHSQGLDKNALPGLHKRKEDEIKKRREGVRMAKGKLMSNESVLSPKAKTVIRTAAIAKNPKVYAAKKVISGVKNVANKITTRVQARRSARAAVKNNSTQTATGSTQTITPKKVQHSSQPPKPKPQFEGALQRQQHVKATMKPAVKALSTPIAGPASGAAAAAGALANKKLGSRIAKAPSTIKKTAKKIKAKTSFGPSFESKGLWANIHAKRKRGEKMNPKGHPDAPTSKEMQLAQEASAAEVLKKRYASYHPDDNPQATRKLRDDEHDQPKGANVYKMHPGAKLTDRGYSKKGKMAALKKQHERRPEKYGITRESYAARIAEKMDYPKSAQADMNKMADKSDKDWWKAQDKAKQREDSNKAKLNKINNMGTRHGT